MAEITRTFGENTVDNFTGVTEDAHVRDGTNSGTNYGSATTVEVITTATVNDERHGLFQFDLASSTVVGPTAASLWLRVASVGSAGVFDVYAIVEDFTGGQVTWDNRKTSTIWRTGRENHGRGVKVGEIDTTGVIANDWIEVTGGEWASHKYGLLQHVIAATGGLGAGGTTKVAFVIIGQTNGPQVDFHSAEAVDGSRPYLSVTGDDTVAIAVTRETIGDNAADTYNGATADAELRDGAPTTNFGTATTMGIRYSTVPSGGVRHCVVMFDLRSLTVLDPWDVRIYLPVQAVNGARTLKVQLCEEDWFEGEVTWDDTFTGTAWVDKTEHGSWSSPGSQTVVADASYYSSGDFIVVSWAELRKRVWHGLNGLLTPTGRLNLVLMYEQVTTGTPNLTFHTSEGIDDTLRPYLEVIGSTTAKQVAFQDVIGDLAIGTWDVASDPDWTRLGEQTGTVAVVNDSAMPGGRRVEPSISRPYGIGWLTPGSHLSWEMLALVIMQDPGTQDVDGVVTVGIGPAARMSGVTTGTFRSRGAAMNLRDAQLGAGYDPVTGMLLQTKNASGNHTEGTEEVISPIWLWVRVRFTGDDPDGASGNWKIKRWAFNASEPASYNYSGNSISAFDLNQEGYAGFARLAIGASVPISAIAYLSVHTAPYFPGAAAPDPCTPPPQPVLSYEKTSATSVLLTGSAYAGTASGGHTLSDWQVQVAGGDWLSPVFESLADAVNLTSIAVTGLLADGTVYQARVRYRDGCSVSALSNVLTFTLVAALDQNTAGRILVEDADGVFRDLMDLLNSTGVGGTWPAAWVTEYSWERQVDQPVSQAEVTAFLGVDTERSLSPLMRSSVFNRDAVGLFAELIKEGRELKIQEAVVASEVTPTDSDFLLEWHGVIDSIDIGGTDERIRIEATDLGGALITRVVETEKSYGDGVTDVWDVIQEILDDTMGADAPTLYSPNGTTGTPINTGDFSFAWTPTASTVARGTMLLDAIRGFALQPGWDVRYLRSTGINDHRLTLYEPPRGAVAPTRTFYPYEIISYPRLRRSREDVRNRVAVAYNDAVAGSIKIRLVEDFESQRSYGVRYMLLAEVTASNIDTSDEADRLALAALNDLREPLASFEIEHPFSVGWEINEIHQYFPDFVRTTDTFVLTVHSVRQSVRREDGTATRERTTVLCRQEPVGAVSAWLIQEGQETAASAGETPTSPPSIDNPTTPGTPGPAAASVSDDGVCSSTGAQITVTWAALVSGSTFGYLGDQGGRAYISESALDLATWFVPSGGRWVIDDTSPPTSPARITASGGRWILAEDTTTETLSVYRRRNGGPWSLVTSGLATGANQYTDTLGVANDPTDTSGLFVARYEYEVRMIRASDSAILSRIRTDPVEVIECAL